MSKKIIVAGLFGIFLASIGVKAFDTFKHTGDAVNGKVLYTTNCAVCHGAKGLGDGLVSKTLPVQPADIYEKLSNPFGFRMELADSVLNGMGDEGDVFVMPKFKGVLTEKDVYDILAYVNNINK